jgi:hypothetical protein
MKNKYPGVLVFGGLVSLLVGASSPGLIGPLCDEKMGLLQPLLWIKQ